MELRQLFTSDARGENPPGPEGIEQLRALAGFVRDPIETLRAIDEAHGPIARFRLGLREVYLIADPESIREVLVEKSDAFHKDAFTRQSRPLLGNGLILNEGEGWRRQRKRMAPHLQPRQIVHYADIMADEAERLAEVWNDGEERDIHGDLTGVTMRVVVQTLFDLDLERRVERVGSVVEGTMQAFEGWVRSPWRFVPEPLPNPKREAFERAVRRLDQEMYRLIDQRRERDEPGDDLLYRLIEATDEEGDRMDDEQLRDEIVTMFVAGHETAALTMTYALALMTSRPEILERVHTEVDDALDGGRPTREDLEDLEMLDAAILEAMRLYPPVWFSGRQAIEDVEIGGYEIEAGTQVFLPQCVVHRDGSIYEEPEAFRPERWLEGLQEELPECAYFPFGAGRRICMGNHFAEMETLLVLSTLLKQFDLEPTSDREIETKASMTQRPARPIRLRVHRR